MRSILLLAYQISPTRGSEYAVGWNFAINLAKKNKVYVVCGASGDHMGDTEEVEQYFKDNPNPNVRLVPVKPTRLANLINWPNRIGILGPIFYLAFPFWQKKAYKIAEEIVVREEIDIIHQLNPIGFREPGYLWKIDKPFVWGPIGGAAFVNLILLKYFPLKHKIFFLIKNGINSFQLKYNQRIRKASDKASEIVFCNTENRVNFEKYLGKTGQVISEQGTFNDKNIQFRETKGNDNNLKLAWAGQISYRKNLFLLFRALSLLSDRSKWVLNIIGDGTGIMELKKLADELSISDKIVWHGKKLRNETISIMGNSDLHCMTSLAEGNPAVLYEAISLGVPTISLDQDGMHNTLSNGNGILIPVTTYEETVEEYAKQIDLLIENPSLLLEMKKRTQALSDKVTWEKKIHKFEEIYENAINTYQNKQLK